MAEIALKLFSLSLYALVWLFLAFTDYLDWHGRMEVLETKHPKIAKLVQSRPLRLVLLLMLLGMILSDFKETIKQVETEPFVVKVSVPPPAAPNVVIHKRIIKTTGSGRLDRGMNDQQSNHLYEQLKKISQTPNAPPGLAAITIVHAYPQDRESGHLFSRLDKVFTEAHWKVAPYQGWPFPGLENGAKNELPIGIWIITENQYLQYEIWSELREAGLDSQERKRFLPQEFKGTILVIGYKDGPL